MPDSIAVRPVAQTDYNAWKPMADAADALQDPGVEVLAPRIGAQALLARVA